MADAPKVTKTLYIITGLPRSRSAWLANWFTHGDSHCFHDLLAYTDDDPHLALHVMRSHPAPIIGDSGSGWLLHLDVLRANPDIKVVIVDREKGESIASSNKLFDGYDFSEAFDALVSGMEELKAEPMVSGVYRFDRLDDVAVMKELSDSIVPGLFSVDRFLLLNGLNVQIDKRKYPWPTGVRVCQ